jgi:hypothetical protein
MKRVYILAILFLLSVSSFAQNDWAPPGATWYYSYMNFATEGYIKIEYSKDTLIQGQACKVLEKTWVIHHYISSTTDTSIFDFEYTYLDSNIVYVYRNGEFKTLYDFNTIPGDSFPIAGWDTAYFNAGCDLDGFAKVDSVDIFSFSGFNLKRMHVDATWTTHWVLYGEVIQRIGAMEYMFPEPYVNCGIVDVYEGGPLRCYYDSAFGLYQVGTTPCDFVVGIDEEISGNGIKVFPNPACSFIQVEKSNPQALMLDIFSITGQRVLTKNLSDQTNIISVQDLDAGIYFLRVRNNEEVIHTERLVVE